MAIKAKKLQPVKVEGIASTKKTLEGYSDFIFADYRGLTVEQITTLRNQLREKKLAEAVYNWQRELRDRAYVEIRTNDY